MRFVAEPISQHRLSRFHRWAMLWLAWLAAFLEEAGALAPLSRQAETIAHQWLDRVERVILSIVLLRAAPQVRYLRQPHFSAIPRKDTALRRAIVGGALRRSLRHKSLSCRIEALSQDLDRLVARLVKRLPRGLTRCRPIQVAPVAERKLSQPPIFTPSPAVDTS